MTASRYYRLIMAQSIGFVGTALLTAGVGMTVGVGSTSFHLLLLLWLLPFLGIPHGALDYDLAKRLFRPRFGRAWATGFVGAYLAAMTGVIVCWWMAPTASLAAFLILTLFHFGSGDALTDRRSPWTLRWAEVLGRGGVVLAYPTVFDREVVLLLFSYLAPEAGAIEIVDVMTAGLPLLTGCLAVNVLYGLWAFVVHRRGIDLIRSLELLMLPVMFSTLPALVAFTLYFNGLHSLRHMIGVAGASSARPPTSGWKRLLKTAAPVTAATLALGGGWYWGLGGLIFNDSLIVRVVFIGIASMTYPHVVVVWLANRAHLLAAVPSGAACREEMIPSRTLPQWARTTESRGRS